MAICSEFLSIDDSWLLCWFRIIELAELELADTGMEIFDAVAEIKAVAAAAAAAVAAAKVPMWSGLGPRKPRR